MLSRLDGTLEVSDLAALTGIGEEAVEQILQPLLAAGLLEASAESAIAVGTAPEIITPLPSPVLPYERRTSGEYALGGAGEGASAISDEDRRRIEDLYLRLDKIDHYRLLGITATADTKEVKRAYFALAKLHHPDRYFRKDIGALRPKIDAVFAMMTTALETLSDPDRRAAYDEHLRDVLKTRILQRSAASFEGRGEWKAAADAWRRVVEALPSDAFVLHRLASALLRAKEDFPIALDAVTRAIAQDPTRAEYRITAASIHLAMKHERNALAELETVRELEGDRADIAGLCSALAERVKGAGHSG